MNSVYNVFTMINNYRTYQSYGDLQRDETSFDLTRNEQEIYENIKEADRQRLLRFG